MTTSPVMHWLAAGLPITLLCDLASTADPDSAAINSAERPPADPIWLEVAGQVVDLRYLATGT
jgi:hypothetical protein